jgi:hypothetical protein
MRHRTAVLRRVLANPSLRRVELAFLGFGAAEYGVWVAALVYAYQRGGTTLAAAIAVLQLIPAAVVAPVAARMVDDRGPASVLRIGYVVQALAMGFTAAMMLLGAPAPATYAGAVVAACAVTLTRPAQAALFPSLARTPSELTAVNVVTGWLESVTLLVGPALAGALIGLHGTGAAFGVFAVTVTGSAALVGSLRDPTSPGSAAVEAGPSDEWMTVVSTLRTDPGVAVLLGVVGVQFVALGALDVLVVVLAVKVFALGSSGAGYLDAAFGAGGVVGGVSAVLLVGRHRLVLPLLVAAVGWGAAFVTLGVWPSVAGAFALLAVAGAGRTVLDVSGRTILQRVVPAPVHGRIFGALEGLAMLGLAIGSMSVPVMVDLGGTSAALIGTGGLLIVVGVSAATRLGRTEPITPAPAAELALLRNWPIFSLLSAPVLEGLARVLVRQPVAAGEVVVREHETGDRFYLVAAGELDVTIGDIVVRSLSAGDGFGEIALLRDGIRTATVTARGPATLYVLERAPFLEAVTGSRRATGTAEKLVADQVGSAAE